VAQSVFQFEAQPLEQQLDSNFEELEHFAINQIEWQRLRWLEPDSL